MTKRNLSLTTIVLLLCLLLGACTPSTPTPAPDDATATPVRGREGTLSVYYLQGMPTDTWYQAGIADFKAANPAVTLTVETFETVTEMEQRLQSEWAAGKGPDVVLFSEINTLDTVRLAQNGTFANLTPYMAEFDNLENQYLQSAWDMGRINGQTVFFPIGFTLPNISTTAEIMEQYGVTITDDTDFMQLLAQLDDVLMEYEDDPDTIGVALQGRFYNQTSLPYLMWLHDGFKIDGTTGAMDIDATQLQAIADFSIRADRAFQKNIMIAEKYSKTLADYFPRLGLFITIYEPFANGRIDTSLYKAALDQEHVILPIPSQTGRLTAELSLYGGVSASSKEVALGMAFMHAITQAHPIFNTYCYISANTQTVITNATALRARNGNNMLYAPNRSTQVKAITQARYEQLTEWILGIDTFYLPNHKVENIIQNAMSPYLAGEQAFDACYDDMMRRLNLYLNE